MKVKVIKTRKGEMPMQETNDYSFSQELEREYSLINVYPNIEYQEIKRPNRYSRILLLDRAL
jgi:hypothetical protein